MRLWLINIIPKIPPFPIIKFFKDLGKISDDEAYNVWNMGMGFTLIIDPNQLENLKKIMPDCFEIGKVIFLNKK